MKLNTPVEDIKPALLNEDSAIPIDAELLTLIGYGRTTDGGEGTSTLQEAGRKLHTTSRVQQLL
jgi:hypothetical protein